MPEASIFHPPAPDGAGNIAYWKLPDGASLGLALGNLLAETNAPFLIIVPDSLTASRLMDELSFFSERQDSFFSFPDWETLPYDHFSPHQDIISERLATLYRLPSHEKGAIIATMTTLMQRLPPRRFLDAHTLMIRKGDKINIDTLRTRLVNAGYHSVSQVREHGEFAVRGSIMDIYPMGSTQPLRIDLLDEEVDSIRTFSPDTQRSAELLDEFRLLPAKEFPLTAESIEQFRQAWRSEFSGNPLKCPVYQDISDGICPPGIEYYLPLFFEATATFFDYLPPKTAVVMIADVQGKASEFWLEIQSRYDQGRYNISHPILPPEKLFVPPETVNKHLLPHAQIHINAPRAYDEVVFPTRPAPMLEIQHRGTQPLAALQQFIQTSPGRVLFCAETLGRREVLLQLFRSISLAPVIFHSWNVFIHSDARHGMIVTPIEEGFVLDELSVTVITESQLFGNRVIQRRLRKKSAQDPDALIRDLTEMRVDDPVVHLDHGVGLYRGLQTLRVGDQIAEFLCLEYQGGDKLYVPIASLHLISRYTGADPEHTPISKLGTEQWHRAKKRAAAKARDVAAELLELYARRAARPGHACTFTQEPYAAFCAGFPFEETPDQLNAIEQVTQDMMSDKPMDRVICGDVGFGKTEVAMRAAFLAVQNGKQVAVLVPTTLLAQQHFLNFQDRFADWPMQVESLSRFRTLKEQKNILEHMKDGKTDIVIGTHKLLQQDVQFKSLGLVIIDEEHRFGVKQKEKLKSLRANVDILTLTATPIPRTLNMALAGIRDLSIMATPPLRRLSVKTFVHEYQESLIQEAIQREILRGGQVYFLHNDISSINKKAEELSALVQEARVTVAHGQMHERELERIMSAFYHRHYNVLVCSTIIESGIDVPTANTILINRADKFGIAQLHQLRGRVGRSHHQAYAYLLVPPRHGMTDDAVKRLDAIAAFDDLGIGFTLATHDLEIRGAGELLGEEQSGDIQEVGFTLYMDLLSRAVDALKSGKEPDLEKSLLHSRSEIDLHLTALIPEDYLPDIQLRLQFYKRIANARTSAERDEIQVTMIDRFGLLPEPLKNLFSLSELKQKADALGIIKIEANEKGGKFDFTDKPAVKPETVIRLIQTQPKRFRIDGPTRLRFTLDIHEPKSRIMLIDTLLAELAR